MSDQFYKPQQAGETIEGTYTKRGKIQGKFGIDEAVQIDDWIVVLGTMLKSLFDDIAIGSTVRIRFNGSKKNPKSGYAYKHFTVWKQEASWVEVRPQRKKVETIPDAPPIQNQKNIWVQPKFEEENAEIIIEEEDPDVD